MMNSASRICRNPRLKAFTLLELIIVIVILAILALISYIAYEAYLKSAKSGVVVTKLSEINKAMDIFAESGDRNPRMLIEHSGSYVMTGTVLWGSVTLSPGEYNTPNTNYSVGPLRDELCEKIGLKKDMVRDDEGNRFIVSATNLFGYNGSKIRLTQAAGTIEKDGASVAVVKGGYMKFAGGDVGGLVKWTDGWAVIENGSVPYVLNNTIALLGGSGWEMPPEAPSAVAIATGPDFACAIINTGEIRCWGNNSYGQLGNGTSANASTSPVAVTGISGGAVKIQAGWTSVCMVNSDGGAKCWGENSYGNLGNGDTNDRNIPTDVSGLTSGVADISIGWVHTCALMTTWGVKCWGGNWLNQLGSGDTDDHHVPVDVVALSSWVKKIGAGNDFTCVLTTSGWVKCWGISYFGQLGNGSTDDSITPSDVTGLTSGVADISVGKGYGGYGCAVLNDGSARCWGNNQNGTLGNGDTNDQLSPVQVIWLTSGVAKIATGLEHACAIMTSGNMKCWGKGSYGALGNDAEDESYIPVDATAIGGSMASASLWFGFGCGGTSGGAIKCWGDNGVWQLGAWTHGLGYDPWAYLFGISSGVSKISAPIGHQCIVMWWGVKCRGGNYYGELGNGTNTDSIDFVDVSGLTSGVVDVAIGSEYSCALLTTGAVQCWGNNSQWFLGDGTTTNRNTPVAVSTLGAGTVSSIATSGSHTCVVLTTGGVKCWGDNNAGQLGDTTTAVRLSPVAVSTLGSGVAKVALGHRFSCALTSAGAVKCWGSNSYGALGDGTNTNRLVPVTVSTLGSGVVDISALSSLACAITTAGAAVCWGNNENGQLGDGTTTDRNAPVSVSGLSSGVLKISPGWSHTCAITTSGNVKCWGANWDKQLGNGSTDDSSIPVDTLNLSDVAHIAASYDSDCALLNTGGIKCWGSNRAGVIWMPYYHRIPVSVDF